jgi:flagellar basal-body rod protein FlgG
MPDGTLTTTEGHTVFGDDGPVKFPPGAAEIVIGANGDVVVDGNRVDRLRLVSFEDEQALVPGNGRTLIDPAGNGAAPTSAGAPVMAGYQEKANLSMIKQMTEMIAAHRLYDVTMSAIRTHGQVENKAAREIAGRF